jgi:branched-subunit amino acid aminotransferase/4-amino-4-deoxychorismate lyase
LVHAMGHGVRFEKGMYLDSRCNRNSPEFVFQLYAPSITCLQVSSCNIFVVKGDTVKTPPLKGTILAGVTRSSVLTLLADMGYNVLEEPISVEETMQADEVFTTGTAVVVSSVGSLTYQGVCDTVLRVERTSH